MAAKSITLRLVAFSDAAGKFEPDAPLNGNEDNFFIDDDLTDNVSGPTRMDTPVPLGDYGCIMAVADGMGGQNAGEVASEIAVDTIADLFSRDRLTPQIIASPQSRAEYIKQTIIEADRRVKAGVEGHPEREGMGSTIIITWIIGDEISVGWLGDSRAYRFNPRYGLKPISKDHTYVQELADKGIITYDDTFGHPQGNIVTRSLGDPGIAPLPECINSKIYSGDVIMMCSDGLSGVVPDRPMRGISDSLEGIMASNYDNLSQMRAELMDAAKRQHWYDNVTVLLCRLDGNLPAPPKAKKSATAAVAGDATKPAVKSAPRKDNNKKILIGIVAAVLVAAAVAVGIKFLTTDTEPKFSESEEIELKASPQIVKGQTVNPAENPEAPMPKAPVNTPHQQAGPPAPATTTTPPPTEELASPQHEVATVAQEEEATPATSAMKEAIDWKNNLVKRLVNFSTQVPLWEKNISELTTEINKAPADADEKTKNKLRQRVTALENRLPLYLELVTMKGKMSDASLKKKVDELLPKLPGMSIDKIKSEIEKLERAIAPAK